MNYYLSDFVYGAVDGIITTFAVISGTAGAKLHYSVIIILGVSNVIADGFSMASSRYLSAEAEKEIHGHRYLSPSFSAIVTFFSFTFIGLIPILIFILAYFASYKNINYLYKLCYFITGMLLFLVGIIKGYVLEKKQIWKSGIEVLTIGGFASFLSYIIGKHLGKLKY